MRAHIPIHDANGERVLKVCGFSHARPGPLPHVKRTYGQKIKAEFEGFEWRRDKVTRIQLSCGHEVKGNDIKIDVGDYFFCVKCRDGVP